MWRGGNLLIRSARRRRRPPPSADRVLFEGGRTYFCPGRRGEVLPHFYLSLSSNGPSGLTVRPREHPTFRDLAQIRSLSAESSAAKEASSSSTISYDRDTGLVIVSKEEEDDVGDGAPSKAASFQTVIGIEVHAQLSVPTKLFSNAPTRHHPTVFSESSSSASSAAGANALVSPHDMGYPGTLPRISSSAVRAAVLSSHALRCQVQRVSRFERKHYSYPDLPLGYQVTQQRWPVATNGEMVVRRKDFGDRAKKTAAPKKKKKRRRGRGNDKEAEEEAPKETATAGGIGKEDLGKFFSVGIDRVQIEQDTGKTTVEDLGVDANGRRKSLSLVDLNRAGSALIEIVFRPDVRSAHEAASVVAALQQTLRHIGTCDGKMEEGSLRCDLNVSIAPLTNSDGGASDSVGAGEGGVGDDDKNDDNPFAACLPPGTGHRVEVKNLNSIQQVIEAAEYEAVRQVRALSESGRPTERETRTYDPREGVTVKIRNKGGAVDYRFMPEPDLPPLVLNERSLGGSTLERFLSTLPELPEEVTSRLVEQYGLAEDLALVITADRPAIEFYEEAVKVALRRLEEGSQSVAGGRGDEEGKVHPTNAVALAVANWLTNDLFGRLKKESAASKEEGHDAASASAAAGPVSVEHSAVDYERLGSLVALVVDGTVSTPMGKKILGVMFSSDEDSACNPRDIAEKRGWKVISDRDKLNDLCRRVVLDERNKGQLVQYAKGGKHVRKITKFFVGRVMGESGGNAHPEIMAEELEKVLEEESSALSEDTSDC